MTAVRAESSALTIDKVTPDDVAALWALEQQCFETDRLSKRRMRHYATASNAEFIVAREQGEVLGYALLLLRRGTLLTRLYSIAVAPAARGKGVAQALITHLEGRALSRGKHFMRLEVAEHNHAAIRLYGQLGFRQFGVYPGYYSDAANALRMQKSLVRPVSSRNADAYPYYQQTTEFTCGPAALMMAMAQQRSQVSLTQQHELQLWRHSTTIYMTSGHGGCHPVGLALAAKGEGFSCEVWLSHSLPMFVDGVRSEHKKQIVAVVEAGFADQAVQAGLPVTYGDWRIDELEHRLRQGASVVCLISTYAFDKRKAPHWVTVTRMDEQCVYIHDPDDHDYDAQVEHQHVPVAREEFMRLASYGRRKFRAAIIIEGNNSPERISQS